RVVRRRGEPAAVGSPGQLRDHALMAGKDPEQPEVRGIVDADRPVAGGAGDLVVFRVPGDRGDPVPGGAGLELPAVDLGKPGWPPSSRTPPRWRPGTRRA